MFHVEHLVLILTLIFVVGCEEKPMPNPELSDLIFKDLLTESKSADASWAQALKDSIDLKRSLAELPPRDPGRDRLKQQVAAANQKLLQMESAKEFHKLRTQLRLTYIKENYPKYFLAKRAWPDQAEYQRYQINKRLRLAPKEWAAHLPKSSKKTKPSEGRAEKTESKH